MAQVKSILFFCAVLFALMFLGPSLQRAEASCPSCVTCIEPDCQEAGNKVQTDHKKGEEASGHVMDFISQKFNEHRRWMYDEFYMQHILPALMQISNQLTTIAGNQIFAIGTFIDAENQLETQRLFQEMQTGIHRDYQPSQKFCAFGTNVRALASSEAVANYNKIALSQRQLNRQLGSANSIAARDRNQDKANRWRDFTRKYCDTKDNNWDESTPGTGLTLVCQTSGVNSDWVNLDVDYGRLIDEPRTLEIDFADPPTYTSDEEDVMALAANLYGHDVLTRDLNKEDLIGKDAQQLYFSLRSIAAKRAVAENSYNSIIALKSEGTTGSARGNGSDTWQFLYAVMSELGVDDYDVRSLIGTKPSYYSQLEILAKKIYQSPSFYSGLYESPTNVSRRKVAMLAIERMLDRAIFESQLRQEMAMSVLLSSKLRKQERKANRGLTNSDSL